MYHVADCVAAAITSKNKGVFMSSLTDLVFINVLPPFFLPHYHQPPHITPLPPIILTPNGALETTPISFTFVSHPSTTHMHTHIARLRWGLPETCHVFSPSGWSAQADIHSHSSPSLSPPGPFTRWKRLIAWNTSGVISADSRSIAFDIKQTGDYCDDNKLCANRVFAHGDGICSNSWR